MDADQSLQHVPFADGPAVVVRPLSNSQWRVCDDRYPQSDARSLLGFIENGNHCFDVVELDCGGACSSASTWSEAMSHFSPLSQSAR